MARLPQPGQDKGTWGNILNDFLSESHNEDGTLKNITQAKVTGLPSALEGKLSTSEKGQPGGIGTLDSNGKQPEGQIPARLSEASLVNTVEGAIDSAGLVRSVTIDDDEFVVKFDDNDPFIRANEIDGIHNTKISHLADSVPASALTIVRELEDSQGWAFAFQYQNGEVAFGMRNDGSWYPSALDGQPNAVATPVTIHGDSLTAGWTAATAQLSTLLGRTVTNVGNGGTRSPWIAARQGGAPLLITVDGGVIPASGTVNVTIELPTLIASTSTGMANGSYQGVLSGVTGQLTITAAGVGTFMRASTGRAIPVQPLQPFVTGLARRDTWPIYWAGRNNFKLANEGAQIVSDTRAMMSWNLHPEHSLVLSILPWAGEELGTNVRNTLDSVNTMLKEAFPTAYEDIGMRLRSEALLLAVGITPTATDVDNIANGLTPESLRSDSGHLNTKGYEAMNILITEIYQARGWL